MPYSTDRLLVPGGSNIAESYAAASFGSTRDCFALHCNRFRAAAARDPARPP
jgi:hypothetical protein